MRLQQIGLRGFQSYRSTQVLVLDPNLTFLAGLNDVGKSALLRALRFLVERQEGISGDFFITFSWNGPVEHLIDHLKEGERHGHGVLINTLAERKDQTLVAQFVSSGNGLWCSKLELPDAGMAVENIRQHIQAGWSRGPFANNTLGVGSMVEYAEKLARRVKFITPRRVQLGERALVTQTEIAADGSNLTDVLLYMRNNQIEQFEELQRCISDAFPSVRGITIRQNASQREIIGEPAIIYQDGRPPIPLRLCGSGIEQMLVLGTSVITAERDTLLLIDEPQAYLHPHAERSLLRLLDSYSEHQYVIATHSHQLLKSKPLRQTRLISSSDGESFIASPSDHYDVLERLGVTAADLWLADTVLWVEGPSEEAAFAELLKLIEDDRYAPIEVRAMPGNASRFAARTERQARAAYAFCEEVSNAVSPMPVTMRFLFDTDEKPTDFRSALGERSNGRALFLPCRELENLFLNSSVITAALQERCLQVGHEPPDPDAVSRRLDGLLAEVDNCELYPPDGDTQLSAQDRVRASRVLNDLYWHFSTSQYDKVKDAPMLVRHAYLVAPNLLDPLVEALDRLRREQAAKQAGPEASVPG